MLRILYALCLFFCLSVHAADNEQGELCDACQAVVIEALYERVEKAEEDVLALQARLQELLELQASGPTCVIL